MSTRLDFASLACFTCALICSSLHAQTASQWNGSDGSWSDAAKWTNGVPVGQFSASITANNNGGTITQDIANLSIWGLDLNSANTNLVLDNDLTISNSLQFNAGVVSGVADLNVAAGAMATFAAPAVFTGQSTSTLRINGTATVDSVFETDGFFELSGNGIVQGSGLLSVNNAFTWDGGTMSGTGVTSLNQGSLILGGNLDRTVNNTAGLIMAGSGLSATNNGVWNNLGGDAIFKISGDEDLLGQGKFNNLSGAFLKKAGGSGTSVVEWDVIHEGQMILVEDGTFSFKGNSFLNGQLMVEEPGTLDFNGNAVFGANATNAGEGRVSFSGGTATFNDLYNADLDTAISGNVLVTGAGDLVFNRSATIKDSVISGAGNVTFNDISSVSGAIIDRDVQNNGQLTATGSSTVFQKGFSQSASAQFHLDNATVEFTGPNATTIDGELVGQGAINAGSQGLIVEGDVAPGDDNIGQLNVVGDLTFAPSSRLHFDLSSPLASDLISVSGDLTIDGSLSLNLLNQPSLGTYTIFQYGGDLQDLGLDLLYSSDVQADLFHDVSSKQIQLRLTSIPEPASLPILMGGMTFLLRYRHRKPNGLLSG